MYARKRKLSALILLITMAMNFALEGASLYAAYAPRLFPRKAEPAVCKLPITTGTKSSCCSAKKAPAKKSCGCPHCGDHCPMGDACTCNSQGKQTVKHSDGLFFHRPSCHSDADDLSGNYLPLSMRVIFLEGSEITPAEPIAIYLTFPELIENLLTHSSPPLVPPPRVCPA